MQAGSKDVQVLLIDVRSRHEFDDGHIMSQSTICIEPDIVQRDNISANEVSDSMVLAPTSEARLFERRHEFDVVVFYDHDSSSTAANPFRLDHQFYCNVPDPPLFSFFVCLYAHQISLLMDTLITAYSLFIAHGLECLIQNLSGNF